MAVPAGRLRHPIVIEELQITQDPNTGEMTEAWAEVASEWAAIEGIHGREFLAADAEQAKTTYRITMRARALDPAMRIVSDGTTYGIDTILPDNNASQLTVMASVI